MKSIKSLIFSLAFLFSSAVFATPVNINTATASQIADALSGIGESKAAAIVAYREQNGKFKQASDIMHVKGIGNSTYEKNKKDILVK